MQVMEFSKGRDAALGVTVAPESVDAFMAEFRKKISIRRSDRQLAL